MQYTRKQIIEFLEKNHSASVPELSQRLNLTITNIRHHVKELEHRDLVREIDQIPGGGRGRPTKVYGLTSTALEDNLPSLTTALLQIVFTDENTMQGESLLDRYHDVAVKMIGPLEHDPNPIYRLNKGITWLNQHHYQARWEASSSGPRIVLDQCPYRDVQVRTLGICQLDRAILCHLFGVRLENIVMSHLTIPGSQQCTFDIK
jgi:predicted ArsR family transcriptional regulator